MQAAGQRSPSKAILTTLIRNQSCPSEAGSPPTGVGQFMDHRDDVGAFYHGLHRSAHQGRHMRHRPLSRCLATSREGRQIRVVVVDLDVYALPVSISFNTSRAPSPRPYVCRFKLRATVPPPPKGLSRSDRRVHSSASPMYRNSQPKRSPSMGTVPRQVATKSGLSSL